MCFAKYPTGKDLGVRGWLDCLEVIDRETAYIGRRKVNFVGGEPLLLPFIDDLIADAKKRGFVTGIVTNDRTMGDDFLDHNAGSLDIIGVSVDSVEEGTNLRLGRCVRSIAWSGEEYLALLHRIRSRGYELKINTVVSALNHREDFTKFIAAASPDRWKVMQCLIVKGQNDSATRLAVSEMDFAAFVSRHGKCRNMIVEDSESMRGSYVMIDPLGRPYGNAGGLISFGLPVLEHGLIDQLAGLGYSGVKARTRGADYF